MVERLLRHQHLNWVLILMISVFFIFIVVALGIKSNNEVHDIVQAQFADQQLLLSGQISNGIEQFLQEKTINIEILAMDISDASDDVISARFINLYNSTDGIYVLEFINDSGVVSLGYPSENTPLGYNLYEHDQAWAFERVKERKTTYITDPLPLLEGGVGAFIWTPVYRDDEFKGTVLAIIRISDLSKNFLRDYESPGNIYMITRRGTVLYDSAEKYPVGLNYPQTLNNSNPQLERILQEQMNGSEGTDSYFENNSSDMNLIAYSPIIWRNQRWSVAVTSPASAVGALIYSVYVSQALFIGVSGVFIVTGSLMIFLLLNRWNKELELEVINKTQKINESNELLKNANKKLRELDKLKSDFVSMVSHELKTPLTAIKTSAEFMLHSNPEPAIRRDMTELIVRNIDRQTRMVDDLLDISRIEAGKMRYVKEMVDINEIINISIETLKKQYDDKDLKLKVDLPDNLSKILADRDKLIQVFTNLLSNALKFTNRSGNVQIEAKESENQITVSVKDDGIGISPDKIDKIFDKLYQIDNSSSRSYGGYGLGLAITKGIIDGHGGNIRVESTLGEGTTFILTFNKSA